MRREERKHKPPEKGAMMQRVGKERCKAIYSNQ